MNTEIEIEGRNGDVTTAAVCGMRDTCSARVWMVDDNETVRGLMANLLNEEGGFECERQFSNPVEALTALEHGAAPDIILLDVQMGKYNGLDFVRPLKLAAHDTHVLMLTTFSAPDSRARAFRDGASDFLSKSWTLDEITTHMRRAMEFGPVAGLLTAYLSGAVRPAEEKIPEPKPVKVAPRMTLAERWMGCLRGLSRFSPS